MLRAVLPEIDGEPGRTGRRVRDRGGIGLRRNQLATKGNCVDPLYVLAAFLAGAAVVWLLQRGRDAAKTERLRAAAEQLGSLRRSLCLARGEAARLATLDAQLSTQLQAEKAAHERLTNEFKALAAEALGPIGRIFSTRPGRPSSSFSSRARANSSSASRR